MVHNKFGSVNRQMMLFSSILLLLHNPFILSVTVMPDFPFNHVIQIIFFRQQRTKHIKNYGHIGKN